MAGLASELDAAGRAGCAVEWTDAVPLPFTTAGGVCWQNQAQLHASAYLASLVEEAVARGVRIFDETPATGVDKAGAGGHPYLVHTSRFDVRAKDVFVAASVPVNNRVLLHTKITAYRSHAIALDLSGLESGRSDPSTGSGSSRATSRDEDLPPQVTGLFWDSDSPYHYTRSQEVAGRGYLIVGGEDHRTGVEADTDRHFDALATYAEGHFAAQAIRYRWSGQIIEPIDGLPFIGLNAGSGHVYVATGYSGNGMTFGTLAGMIVTDLVLGRDNPYVALYDATRVKPLAAARAVGKSEDLLHRLSTWAQVVHVDTGCPRGGRLQAARSTASATPFPPPRHSVAIPRVALRRCMA